MSGEVLFQEETTVIPFALQFIEAIPQTELKEVSGRYNDELQVWEYGDGKLARHFQLRVSQGLRDQELFRLSQRESHRQLFVVIQQ